MRLPNSAHQSHPWRIRDLAPDFIVEDVWALPAYGGADDFHVLLEMMSSLDPTNTGSVPARALWRFRDLLGRWLDVGGTSTPGEGGSGRLPIPGTDETSLASRLPDDLRDTAEDVDFGSLPFRPLYRTDDEFAAEVSNRTVHGVVHLAWAPQGGGRYQGQMTVYVKPRGPFGKAYMSFIRPFRHWVVYPAMMRQFEGAWTTRIPR